MGVTVRSGDKSGVLHSAQGDNSGAVVEQFCWVLSGLGRGRGWPMQCSQLHQIAENYSSAHCNLQRSVNLITPAQTGAVLGGEGGGTVHAEIVHNIGACIVVFRAQHASAS